MDGVKWSERKYVLPPSIHGSAILFLDLVAWSRRLYATARRFLPGSATRFDRDSAERGLNVLATARPGRFLTVRAVNLAAHGLS